MPTQEECSVELAKPLRVKVRICLAPRSQPFDESTESLGMAIATAQAAGFHVVLEKVRRGVPGFHNAGPVFAHFLADASSTHLFIAADDVIYPRDILIRLVNDDKDIVAGIYRKGTVNLVQPANFVENTEEFLQKLKEGGVYETKFGAGHTMLIQRRVIEKMVLDYPELAYQHDSGETQYGLMLPMIRDGRAYQDDYAFSIRAKESGFTIWDDYGCRCLHYCYDFLGFEGVQNA